MSNKTFYTTLTLFLVTLCVVLLISRRGEPKVVATNLEKLPMEILGYIGREDSFSDDVYKELNADKHVYRHYRSADGKQVDLYIGYYGTAKGGRTGHNPYGCLPASGWGILKEEEFKLDVDTNPKQSVKVNYILSRKGVIYDTVLHWYQSDKNKVLASGIEQNIQRFLGRLLKNRNDGAFVRISMNTDEKGVIKATENIKQFTTEILKLLPKYWPEEN